MPRMHSYELVANRAAQWVDDTAVKLAQMIREDGRGPFAEPLSEPERLAHYEQMLFHPDGSENSLGSKQLLARFGSEPAGITKYAQIKAAVLKARADRVAVQELPPMEG